MSSSNRLLTLGTLMILFGVLFYAVFTIRQSDIANLSAASASIKSARYHQAENHISKVLLPTFRNDANALRSKIRDEETKDAKALADVDRAALLLKQTLGDQDATRATPDAIIDGVTTSLSVAFSRPFVASLPVGDLNKRFSNELPGNAIILVDDFHSKMHALRTVRFVISDHVGAFGTYGTLKEGCFDTPFQCRFFNELYNRLLLVSPVESGFYGPSVTILENPNGIGTFQGARLVDWKDGAALSVAGRASFNFGGNSGSTWFSSIRLSKHALPVVDDKRNPSLTGVSSILDIEVNGVDGTDNGVGQNVFWECHACEHVTREIVAKWDTDEGIYLLQKSRIRPTPYVTIISFVQAIYDTDEFNYLAPNASESAKSRLRDFKRNIEDRARYNSRSSGCYSGGTKQIGDHFESIITCPSENSEVVYTLEEEKTNGSYVFSDIRSS